MKTKKDFKDHFSDNEIKILIDIIYGRQDFSVMEDEILSFYEDDYDVDDLDIYYDELREELISKLEFDLEYVGFIN
mgnify:CR=1 FL=1|jgi:hypothetical protein